MLTLLHLASLLLPGCSDYKFVSQQDLGGGADSSPPAADTPRDTEVFQDCVLELAPEHPVQQDETCSRPADPAGFDPQEEWSWRENTTVPGYDDIMMTPVVGDIDRDGIPEILFTAYTGSGYGSAGALMVLSGDGAGEEAGWTDLGGYQPVGSAGIAIGDLEGDGSVEILTVSTSGHLLCIDPSGALLWAAAGGSGDFSGYSYPSLADLDGDGLSEIVVGRAIFSHDGRHLASGSYGVGGSQAISVVADLDLDGEQEILVGNAAYRPDGSALWTSSLPDGWTAVGDFDGDGLGEVVSVGTDGQVYLSDSDGSLIWGPMAVPGGGGGPPTVADLDGDGRAEVGVAGHSGYVVYDNDGTTLWTAVTQDQSSARTGSSVFDFEGDGQWEIIYADEITLWVYDGATGTPILQEDQHSSWTLFEYPLVVDVDADGASELLLASNDSQTAGWQGITVIGDRSETWAPSAEVWNQHAYSITNVQDDLGIPRSPVPNWTVGHNSFRAGGLGERAGYPLADLRILLEACWSCEDPDADPASPWVELAVTLENTGLLDVSGMVDVALYAEGLDGSLTWLETVQLPGPAAGTGGPALELLLEDLPPADELAGIVARADDPGSPGALPTLGEEDECDEDNATLTAPSCPD